MSALNQKDPISLAFEYHRAGRLNEAQTIYREILSRKPEDANALHLLGMLVGQMGRHGEAIDLLRRAIASEPMSAIFRSNFGNILRGAGKLDLAIAAYREAIRLQPDSAEAMSNLANALSEKGELEEAAQFCRRAIQLKPQLVASYNNLSLILISQRKYEEAIAMCRRAIEIRPEANGYNNLGMALANSQQTQAAIEAFKEGVRLKPDFGVCRHNLAQALFAMGRMEEAIVAYREAANYLPGSADVQSHLGIALARVGRMDEAVAVCRRGVELSPGSWNTHNELAIAFMLNSQFDESVAEYRRAIELSPQRAEVYYNLGNALREQGLLDEGLASIDRAVELRPDDPTIQGCRLYMRQFDGAFDAESLRQEYARWNERHARPLRPPNPIYANDASPDRRLRIGYVSPNFSAHVVGRNVLPLLGNHDHGQFEIHCFCEVARPDVVTERFRNCADRWHSTRHLSVPALADLVRREKIDILVDLTLHMTDNRMLAFALKPAPVQVTFAGYPGSTGLETMDYRLTDPHLDPPGAGDAAYVERSVRLPDTFWCYDPAAMQLGIGADPEVGPLPSLATGRITFGCLNNFCKVNDAVLDLWARVLGKVPESQMLIMGPMGNAVERIREKFARRGIAGDRLKIERFQPRGLYLKTYNQIDIGLDTFPYNGHTTSLDAMWMGVPVVTLVGQTVVGRAGLSQLTNLGLTDLIATSADQYIEIAASLAQDPPRLIGLRSTLRQRMLQSPLCDAPRFARNIEAAYRKMWQDWCAASKR